MIFSFELNFLFFGAGEAERYSSKLQLHGRCAEGGLSLRQEVAPQKEASGAQRSLRKFVRGTAHCTVKTIAKHGLSIAFTITAA
jgi:hypothetical protein